MSKRNYDTAMGGLVTFTGTEVCHKCGEGMMKMFDGDGYHSVLRCYDENTGMKFHDEGSGCGNIIYVHVSVDVEVVE